MKLPELKNPLTNNISLNPVSLISNIGWVAGVLMLVAWGQTLKNKAASKLPLVDGSIEPIISQPSMSTIPQKVFY